MKRTWKKLFAFVCAFTLVAAPAAFNGNSMWSGADGTIVSAAENSTDYTITIPATLSVANAGWNATDGIKAQVKSDDTFDASKRLTVTAASTNNWALKSGDYSVGYNLATASATYDASATPASWEFSAADLNAENGTKKDMGIIVEDYSNMPAGSYTDTVTFTASVENAEQIIDLSILTSDYVAQDGDILTNESSSSFQISIASGAVVTLRNAKINGKDAGITCPGDATITLEGNNIVTGHGDYPGIFITPNYTLTINGEGILTSTGGNWGAGIGAGDIKSCGNIKIISGTINAAPGGSSHCTGIGGARYASCGDITITGGVVTANGGYNAAGIGCGYSNNSGRISNCGNIIINGGTVTAHGGSRAAGIGGGYKGAGTNRCGNITITDTVTMVSATKGDGAVNSIGAGEDSVCGTVTIGGVEGAITDTEFVYQP